MSPTRGQEEIEGHSYKDYVYSPVSASISSAAQDSATPGKDTVELTCVVKESDWRLSTANKCNDEARASKNHEEERYHRKMSEKGSTLMQYVAAASANLCILAAGAMLSWTSPISPKLQNKDLEDNPFGRVLTLDEISWIGSLVAIGTLFGSFVAGYVAERWGRKKALLSSVVPFLLGWLLVATANNVIQLYAARLIFGFAQSFPFTALPMYCGEIAETSVRGTLGSFLQLFITFGLTYSYAIGPFVSYTVLWIAGACLPVIFLACFITMPESPYFLLIKGRKEEATNSLARLRSKTTSGVQKEIDDMQEAVNEAFKSQAKVSDLFTVKANFKALLFTCALVAFQQLTGINVVLFYMENIFKASGTSLDPAISTICVSVVQIIASSVTPLVVDRLGRRLLLIISGIGTAVTLAALGLYFYLKEIHGSDAVVSISWLPVTALVIYISTYCIGWGPLPWAVMGEMFASDVKSKASGITVCVCWLLAFFITKFSSNLTDAYGNRTTFSMYGVWCVISVLFVIFLLPETKGKTLQQIQDELNGVKPSINNVNDVEFTATKK